MADAATTHRMGRALHLVTTGSVYEAQNPLFNGLFSELLPSPEAVLPRALELAKEISDNTSTVSTNLMRELMYRNPGTAEGTHLLDSEVISGLFNGPDNTEGVRSFKEKRPAKFTANMLEGMAHYQSPLFSRSILTDACRCATSLSMVGDSLRSVSTASQREGSKAEVVVENYEVEVQIGIDASNPRTIPSGFYTHEKICSNLKCCLCAA
jgi:hypothetical protein